MPTTALKTKGKALKSEVIISIKIAWQKVIDLTKLIYVVDYKCQPGYFKDGDGCKSDSFSASLTKDCKINISPVPHSDSDYYKWKRRNKYFPEKKAMLLHSFFLLWANLK